MSRSGHIPSDLYKKILAVMPIPCVDVIVACRGKFLLGKRKNKPAQGEWWFVGGRVLKGERLLRAVRRHVRTETGITTMKIEKLLTAKETIFKNSAQGPASHTINTIFLVSIPKQAAVKPANAENSEMRWFHEIKPGWQRYVQESLRLAGWH